MAIETRTTQIGSNTYGILTPVPTVAMPLVNRVAVLLGPLLSTLKKEASSDGWSMFTSAIQNVDPNALQSLFMDAVKASRLCVNNQPIFNQMEFDQYFGDHKADVYQVCLWCTWECVKDFFPQLGGIVQNATEAAQMAFQFPKSGQ